jgi:hypothetical protein
MNDWTTIEQFVAEHERDPEMAERLRAARRRLAPILYPEGGKQYERMMRGFGPPQREPPHCPTCDCPNISDPK